MIGYMYSSYYSLDPLRVYEACGKSETNVGRTRCYFTAFRINVNMPEMPSDKVALVCKPFQDNKTFHTQCLDFVVRSLAREGNIERLVEFCKNVVSEDKIICIEKAGINILLKHARDSRFFPLLRIVKQAVT
jgi:hypothetical protein